MTELNVSVNSLQAPERFDVSTPQEIQKRLIAIDQALRLRFPDYSPDVEKLAPLSSILDAATLDELFEQAWRESSFEDFCRSVSQTWDRYSALIESEEYAPRIPLANVFNNHVATVLGKRGKITAQFLKMSVRRISPKLAEQLDFDRAKSEPTVFVFGNNVSRICDLLFSIPYKDGRPGFFPIIVLMEHKSAPERNVALQMLTSLVATLDFAKRYPERFKTPDGKFVWPFVVLFYTGAQQWNEVKNLPELFTTSLKELDQDWIFNLRFLLVSLVHKKIDVVPTIPHREGEAPPETFDEALMGADWLGFFFDLLRKAEILASVQNTTREEWLDEFGKSLRILKGVYEPGNENDGEAIDDALGLVSTMCAKKRFVLPSYYELLSIMEKEGVKDMICRIRLLSNEEREAARREGRREGRCEGRRDGERDGEIRGKQEILTQIISMRFPTATPEFIQKILDPLNDSYATELTAVLTNSNSLEEFQNRALALAPAC